MALKHDRNKRALEKITTGDLSDGALLKPERFNSFFEDVQASSNVLNSVRAVAVTAPSGSIPRLGVGSRQFRQVNEGEAAGEVGVDQPSVDFQTVKMAGWTEFTWESINETIGDPASEIINALANQFYVDLETLASVGDSSSSDAFVGINDGWLQIASNRGSPTYNHAASDGTAQPINKELFSNMLNTIPTRYKEASQLAFLCSYDQRQAYKEYLAENRQTAVGDQMIMSGEQPTAWGYPVYAPSGWPDSQVMLTNMQNLCYIIQDEVRIKRTTEGADLVKRDIEQVVNLITHTDFQVLESEGIVIGNNVAAPGTGGGSGN